MEKGILPTKINVNKIQLSKMILKYINKDN